MSGGKTALGILEQALAIMPALVLTSEGRPQTKIDHRLYKIQGALPLMMLNIFDSNAKTI